MQPVSQGAAAPPSVPASEGRFRFVGTGMDLFVLHLTNVVLTIVTLGFASFLGYTRWRTHKWMVEHVTYDGQPFRYHARWSDEFGHSVLSSLLLMATCWLATPWVIAWNARERAKFTTTADGRQLQFHGSGTDVIGLAMLSWALYVFTLGLGWPVIGMMWKRWSLSNTSIVDPRVPGGAFRLRLDAGPFSYIIPGFLSAMLVQLTLGLYLSTAWLNFERFVWASTTEEFSPRLAVPSGPRTTAQWAVLIGTGVGAIALAALMVVLLVMGLGLSHSVSSSPRGSGVSEQGNLPISPAVGATTPAEEVRTAPGMKPKSPAAPPGTTQPASGARPEGFPDSIPMARSKPPTVSEWESAPPVRLSPDGCMRKVVREWMKLNCSRAEENAINPIAITSIEGLGVHGGDYFTWEKSGKVVDLIVRLRRGKRGTATFELESGTLQVGYDWTADTAWPEPIWKQ